MEQFPEAARAIAHLCAEAEAFRQRLTATVASYLEKPPGKDCYAVLHLQIAMFGKLSVANKTSFNWASVTVINVSGPSAAADRRGGGYSFLRREVA